MLSKQATFWFGGCSVTVEERWNGYRLSSNRCVVFFCLQLYSIFDAFVHDGLELARVTTSYFRSHSNSNLSGEWTMLVGHVESSA